MKAGSKLLLVARFTMALSTVAVAHLVDVDSRSRLSLWADIFNAGHVVLMGAFSLVMLWLSTDALAGRFSNRLSHYAVALSVTVAIGALSEVAQIPGPRNADALDVARDAAGAFCFLGLRAIWDRSLAPLWQRCGTWVRPAVAALVLVTLALSWSAALRWGLAFYYRDMRFPVLCSFDSWWEHLFWTTRNASIEPVASPAGSPCRVAPGTTSDVPRRGDNIPRSFAP